MTTLTVNAKSQVTIPKDLLSHMGVRPGGKIVVDKFSDGRIEFKAARRTGRISDVFNLLKREKGRSLSIGQMSKASARGWAGKR